MPAMFATPEAQAGFMTSLDRFEAYLATLASPDRISPDR